MFKEDRALLPTKREIKIPSIIVYNDINIIIMWKVQANFKREAGVKWPLLSDS